MNSRQQNTLWLILAGCAAAGFGVVLRLLEIPFWNHPDLWVQKEPLMATHDAYAWLAGAEKTGRLTGRPLSSLLEYLVIITGLKPGVVFFWLPAFCAPLIALPVAWVCRLLGSSSAALPAGVLATAGYGFLARTRVGYGDTDILTLFFPFALAGALIWWLDPNLQDSWRFKRPKKISLPGNEDSRTIDVRALAAGLIWAAYNWFYPNAYPIAMAMFLTAVLIGLWQWQKAPRSHLVLNASIVVCLGILQITGIVLVGLVLILEPILHKKNIPHWIAGFTLLVITLVFYFKGLNAIYGLIRPVLGYLKPKETLDLGNATFQLPGVSQSIREAQNVSLTQLGTRMAYTFVYFAAAVAGFIALCLRRPLAALFVPLLALALLSVKLGNRFTMYGPPILGLGLGLGLSILLFKSGIRKPWIKWTAQLALAVALAWPAVDLARKFRPGPIVPKVFAQTFLDLREQTPENAQLWQWWDYGYAAQYYAARKSFGDGGDHGGPFLYPLALAHATDNPLQAAQTMLMVADTQKKQEQEDIQNGTKQTNPGGIIPYYRFDPILFLRDLNGREAAEFMHSLGTKPKTWPNDLPPQYLVLSWENIPLAYWICYFGNWNLATGESTKAAIQRVNGRPKFDVDKGLLITGQQQIPLKTLDVLGDNGREARQWPRARGIHALVNTLSRETYLMETPIYESMLIQMLIGNPQDFTPEFELIQDRFPWSRVYRVKAESIGKKTEHGKQDKKKQNADNT